MAGEQGGEQAPAPVAATGADRRSYDLFKAVPLLRGTGAAQSESLMTVLVALAANLLIAVAKSAAAAVTGSASLVAAAAADFATAIKRLAARATRTVMRLSDCAAPVPRSNGTDLNRSYELRSAPVAATGAGACSPPCSPAIKQS